MSVRMSAYISSWSVSIWRVAYVWSMAACGAFVMVVVCIIIWSSALPESLFHLVMYGVLGWSVGMTDAYGGLVLER